MRSAIGTTGKIHVSVQSQKVDSEEEEEKCYKIQGAIHYNGKEREIDLLMSPAWYSSYSDETRNTTIKMISFYDSVFLCEYYFGDEYDIPSDIPITGQFIKEKRY